MCTIYSPIPLHGRSPYRLHAGITGILNILYFCLIQQAGAGWLQPRWVQSVTGQPPQSWDSNQGARHCQENHARSGAGSGPSVTSALRTVSKPYATLQGKSTRHFYVFTLKGLFVISQIGFRFGLDLVLVWTFLSQSSNRLGLRQTDFFAYKVIGSLWQDVVWLEDKRKNGD